MGVGDQCTGLMVSWDLSLGLVHTQPNFLAETVTMGLLYTDSGKML